MHPTDIVAPSIEEDPSVLAKATVSEMVNATFEHVDLPAWIFSLRDRDYQSFAPGEHKAFGTSQTEDGSAVLICVETVGEQLMVQHYTADVLSASYCRFSSITDVLAGSKWTTVHVTWELGIEGDHGSCKLTNSIVSRATQHFLQSIEAAGITVEQAAGQRLESVTAHNRRETPEFAASLERFVRQARLSSTPNG